MANAADAEGASRSGHRDTTQSPRRPSNRSPKNSNTSSKSVSTTTTKSDQRVDSGNVALSPDEAIAWANHIIKTYLPRISALTGMPQPTDVTVRFGDQAAMNDRGAVAWAQYDGTVELNPAFEPSRNGLTSTLVHEFTHEVLRPLTGAGADQMYVEGLADYIRDTVMQDDGSQSQSAGGNPAKGYQQGAGFFQYVEETHPGAVKQLIQQMAQGTPGPDALQNATGEPSKALRDAYVARYPGIQTHTSKDGTATVLDPGQNLTKALQHPEPIHLTPHYAAGPNPGITAVEAQAQPSQSGGLTTVMPNIIGFEATKPPSTDRQTMGGPPGGFHYDGPSGGGDSGSGSGSGSGGSSSGSGSSSSSGSSAPSKPPMDIYISDTFPQDAVARQKAQLFSQAYIELWGEPATENYIVQAAKTGMNVTEFIHRERMKDAWQFTKAYKDEAKGMFDLLRQMGAA